MNRTLALAVGTVCYLIFFGTFLYLVGFVGGLVVPRTVDTGPESPAILALLVNTALVVLFGIQHSVMARPGFKARWTRIVPAVIERPLYVLASSIALIALMALWQPMPMVIWEVGSEVGRMTLHGVYLAGVALVLYSTFLIDHFDLFGLRQVWLHFRRRDYTEKRFATPALYRVIRHPLYVGWLTVMWVAPTMTLGHFLLAFGMSVYIFAAIPFEERDLASALGEPYRRWREQTPAFLPKVTRTQPTAPVAEAR